MAKKTTGVWGIDLGQCALKAIRVEQVNNEVVATTFDYVEHPKMLNQPDAEPDQLLREALEKFLSRNSLRGDIVAISVPSQSGLARFVKLPPVEEKKIADIVRFEAKQQIPFSLDEVVWDYQKIGAGLVTDGFAMDTEIGLFAMKRDKVTSYLDHFRDVGVEVHIVQMSPLALCNYVSYDLLTSADGAEPPADAKNKKECVVVLDIGTDSSNLVITDGRKIIWQRPIPLGGNHFTRALTKEPFKLSFAKAEHLKRNATKSGAELKQILTALKPVLNDFVGEVQRSLGYFANTHRDAQVSYLLGLGNAFRLPGFQRFLSEKLQLDVRKLSRMERLKGDSVIQAPVYTENVLTFGVAYGLALQGLTLARLQTNLLPPEIRTERIIRRKKPWAVAAAALLFLGVGGLLLAKGKAEKEYDPDNPAIKSATQQANKLKADKDSKDAEFKTKQSEFDKAEKDLKAFSGFHQGDWLILNKLIAESLPTPEFSFTKDGQVEKFLGISPLLPAIAQRYYLNDEKAFALAAEAHIEYLKAQMEGKPLKEAAREFRNHKLEIKMQENPSADPSKLLEERDCLEPNLMILSIEAVKPRYTRDLGAFYNRAKEQQKLGSREIQGAIWSNNEPGAEKGWVIAVRGYTSHFDHSHFIITSLGNNLARSFGINQEILDLGGKRGKAGGSAPPPTSGSEKPTALSSATGFDAEGLVVGKVQQIVLLITSEREKDQIGDLDGLMAYMSQDLGPEAFAGSGASAPPPRRGNRGGAGGGRDDPRRGGMAGGPGGGGAPRVKGSSGLKTRNSSASAGQGGTGFTVGSADFIDIATGNSPFRRSSSEGKVKETEFVFLLFWKGPGPDDFGLVSDTGAAPQSSKSSAPGGPGGRQGMPPGGRAGGR